MALRVHLFYPQIPSQSLKFQTHPFPSMPHLINNRVKPPTISCTKSPKDSDFASDLLAMEVEKINTHLVQREEAMKKSRALLFTELCKYLGLGAEELKEKLVKMEEEDKWVLVKGFVSEWGVDFHPLSAKSVKEMVEEHLVEDKSDNSLLPPLSSAPVFFPGLKKIIGFPPNK